MFGLIPPVGEPIICRRGGKLPAFPGYEARWVSSGTAALAMAMREARSLKIGVEEPEVVLPAYCCPDLVAAAIHAGLRPVLADIGFDDPGYRLDDLESVISARTVAVVAVNFLGIAERLSEIRELLSRHGKIALIEDSAQWYPGPRRALTGDYVCLSFGRGKPVSVLTGGAMLRSAGLRSTSEVDGVECPLPSGKGRGSWEVWLYNALLRPALYRLINVIPGTGLGSTTFKELGAIRGFPRGRLGLVPANVDAYLERSRVGETKLSRAICGLSGVVDLRLALASRADRLLRFPLLLPCAESRDAAMRELVRHGVGATRLYGRPLPTISGVAPLVRSGEMSGARQFAERLLTLPIRAGRSDAAVDAIRRVLSRVVNGD